MGHISKLFIDNSMRFSNSEGTPEDVEKFNLYTGLAQMAEAIEGLELKLKQIESKLNYLQASLG
jgi:hypothetical protein